MRNYQVDSCPIQALKNHYGGDIWQSNSEFYTKNLDQDQDPKLCYYIHKVLFSYLLAVAH